MDEFKPEDELKPDASDRRPTRPRRPPSAGNKGSVSRQRMMMGIGILVLLLLVIGIGSALNGSGDKSAPASKTATGSSPTASSGNERNIDLSSSSSMSGQNSNAQAQDAAPVANDGSNSPDNTPTATASGNSPQQLSAPPIASTPTESKPQSTPEGQRRVELPGDLNSALSSQQNQVNNAAAGAQPDTGISLPTAPATVAPGAARAPAPKATATPHHPAATKPVTGGARHPASRTEPAHTAAPTQTRPAHNVPHREPAAAASRSMPSGNYTLQLSGASREDSLNAWAKKQNLSSYHVYKTMRNGQPWYVLVSGSYATPAEAKRAVASLPASVRAQNPWVKPLSQVKKEAK